MTHAATSADLPLRYLTPDSWAESALAEPLKLLNDHAHLEKKAASNALEMLNRWPDPTPPDRWVQTMAAVARDEVEHLQAVTRLLVRRGSTVSKNHRNPYANDLRQLVRLGDGTNEVMDRLMISALIEARSCERFEILSRCCEDRELAKLYKGLFASEHGHFRVFVDLAKALAPSKHVERRWNEMLDAEATIIAAQPPGPRMHSGVNV